MTLGATVQSCCSGVRHFIANQTTVSELITSIWIVLEDVSFKPSQADPPDGLYDETVIF